ncbi:MAG: NAD(P)-binding protein [Caulobacteraceae bacterium]|nr:NAD(P)-binding protein [Caulobacteraceae bacterium]
MKDRRLGMDRPIARRDFLNGMAVGLGVLGAGSLGAGQALAQAGLTAWPQDQAGYDPPTLTGLRGSHPGSFEAAHAVRDGAFWPGQDAPKDTGETYDLIVVGGGISGLAAAHFFRAARPQARILILDNHDDFGGHAKRNEFHLDGRLHLMNGGTLEIDSPRPYSAVADGLLKTLGIEPEALTKACDRPDVYRELGLKPGIFFDKETFGEDRLVPAPPTGEAASEDAWKDFLAAAALTDVARREILRIETARIDYLPGLTSDQKKDRLSRISYRDFLLTLVRADPSVIPFYQTRTHEEQGVGIDALSALDCWAFDLPGFQGMGLAPGSAPRMGYTPGGYADGGSYTFHFPDGNASIARLLVRDLIPEAIPGHDARDVVTAKADYSRLDRADNAARIRLSSLAVRVRNIGDPGQATQAEVTYSRGGKLFTAKAGACVLASWNMMIPYLCPDLPQAQKDALHSLVKTPLIYTTVALRDWTAFHKLGIDAVRCPGAYHTLMRLNPPVDIGDYAAERSPERPILVHLVRTPCQPGLSESDQNRVGRAEILGTSFETFERNTREQLGRILAGGGFDPARDITAITVNRWPHGYAPEYNPLIDDDLPPERQPQVIGRARFGRIAIANADSGRAAYTDAAIDQAHRAVSEILAL